MKIIVTGGCGFIGSHICDALLARGHSVHAVDNLSTGRRENLDKSVVFHHADVRGEGLLDIFEQIRPDAVYHQAAQISVPRSVQDPAFDAENNICGTINVLEGCKRAGAKLIFAGSAAVYGAPQYLPIDEKHPVNPQSPYGLSKLAAEHYIRLYGELFALDYTIFRYANVYGPRQSASGEGGVAAIFAEKGRKGEVPVIFGDGSNTRDFIHVRDVAAACVLALDKAGGRTINLGTGTPVSVLELCRMLCAREPRFEPPREGDILHSLFEVSKLREVLGFTAETNLARGLAGLLSGEE